MKENVLNQAAKPVSKYAAKKAARIAAAKEVETGTDVQVVENVEESDSTYHATAEKPIKGIPNSAITFPQHIVELALLVKNNAEIRRFTFHGIANYLRQKKEITDGKTYISFKWNKFIVTNNGLNREYYYSEPFFINALIASFTSFSASAQRTIDKFCRKEMSVSIDKAADKEEIETIVALNEESAAEHKE